MLIQNLKSLEFSIIDVELWETVFSKTNEHTVITLENCFTDTSWLEIFNAQTNKIVGKISNTEFERFLKVSNLEPATFGENPLQYIDNKYPNYCGEIAYKKAKYLLNF